MNVSVQSSAAWQHVVTVEIPAEDVERRLETIALEVQRRAVLPGFRKGKVPIHLVRQNFADAIEQRLFEEFLPQATSAAVREAKLEPAVPPLVRNLRFGPGQPLTFEALVDVRPEVAAKDYRGLPLVRRSRAVDDAAVQSVLDRLREESAVFADLERPAERGDVVLADTVRLDANGRPLVHTRGKGVRLELGAPGMSPDLENGLLGATAGDSRTVSVAYAEDHQSPDLAGRTWRYLVRVRKIQQKKLREPDDNFAQDVFKLGSYEELRARVRENLENEERVRVRREMEAAATEQLLQRNPVELPERLVAWMLDRVVAEATGGRKLPEALASEMAGRYRAGVERSIRREVVLDAIARQEKLEAGDDDVAADIERMAAEEPRQAARIRARYQDADRRRSLAETIRERKAMALVLESAEVREEVMRDEPMVVPAG
jgi:trigger factor